MFSSILDHHQLRQEPPRPPRPQEETWRTGGVLTGFNLHETVYILYTYMSYDITHYNQLCEFLTLS